MSRKAIWQSPISNRNAPLEIPALENSVHFVTLVGNRAVPAVMPNFCAFRRVSVGHFTLLVLNPKSFAELAVFVRNPRSLFVN
jgi:hypothetical protein